MTGQDGRCHHAPSPKNRTWKVSLASGSSRYTTAPCDRSRFSPDRFFRHSSRPRLVLRERKWCEQPCRSFSTLLWRPLPCCLDDTRCSLLTWLPTLGPVYLFPCFRLAGGCTRGLLCVHLQFPPTNVLPTLSSRTTRWKSARFRGEVESYPLHYRTALAFSSILCPPFPQRSLRTRLPPVGGEMSGYDV